MRNSILPAFKKFVEKAGTVKGVEGDTEFDKSYFLDYLKEKVRYVSRSGDGSFYKYRQ